MVIIWSRACCVGYYFAVSRPQTTRVGFLFDLLVGWLEIMVVGAVVVVWLSWL